MCSPNSCPTSEDKAKTFNERAACCQQPSGDYIYGINNKIAILERFYHLSFKSVLLCLYGSHISEYDFEQHFNTKCDPKGELVSTLEDGQNACKSTKQCQGVMSDTSSDTHGYFLCPTNATTSFGIDIKTSLHKKIIIGKIFVK